MASPESEYLIALLSKPTGHLTPVCLVMDGPLVHCAPPEPTDHGTATTTTSEIVKAYRVVRNLAIHQRAVYYLLDSAHQSVISMIGAGSVALLCNYAFGPAYRTALRCTSLFIGSKVRLVAEKNQVGNAFLGGHHHIDVDGDVQVVLDAAAGCSLYLLQGTLFLDGRCAGSTADQALVEAVYRRERTLRQECPVSPAVIQRHQLLHTLNVQKEEVARSGGGPESGGRQQLIPTEQQSHQMQIKSHAQVVHQSLKVSRFVFSSFIPVNTGEQQPGKLVLMGKMETNFNAARPPPPPPLPATVSTPEKPKPVAKSKKVAKAYTRAAKSTKGKVVKSSSSKGGSKNV